MTPRIGSPGSSAAAATPPDFQRPPLAPPPPPPSDANLYSHIETTALDEGLRQLATTSREHPTAARPAQVGRITRPPGDIDAERTARIREFFSKFTVEVPVLAGAPGETRRIPVPFRMAPEKPYVLLDSEHLKKALGSTPSAKDAAVVSLGRPTPEQLAATITSLARLHPEEFAPQKSVAQVRNYLRSMGVGIDCAGSVQLALCYSRGLSPNAGIQQLGLKDRLFENLANLPPAHFANIQDPAELRPGDLIIMKPPKYDTVGHTVIVTEKSMAPLTNDEARLLAQDFPQVAKPGQEMVRVSVASSFGWDGPQERTWVYDPTSKQWGDLGGHLFDADADGNVTPTPGQHSGPWDHEIQGKYRAY